jgi:transcriptional regulator with XRE-family HTH domain
MEKSIFTHEHRVFVELLRETREAAGVTQVQLAEKMRTTQSIISKWERGELRLDFVQIQRICRVLGASFVTFAREFDRRTRSPKRRNRGRS